MIQTRSFFLQYIEACFRDYNFKYFDRNFLTLEKRCCLCGKGT